MFMNSILMSELEHNRKRLEYYSHLSEDSGTPSIVIQKWIAIYSERVKKYEHKLSRMGLKTQIAGTEAAAKHA